MTLTRDQGDLLIRWGAGWVLADIITATDAGIRHAIESRSGGATSEWWWDTDAKGIHGWRSVDGRHPKNDGLRVELSWTEVRRAVRDMPARLLHAVADARREHRRQVVHAYQPYGPGNYPVPWAAPPPDWWRAASDALRAACAAAVHAVTETAELALFEVG